MKKYLFTFIVISFLLTGCSKTEVQKTTVNNPYEVAIDNELLSYYESKDNVPKTFEILDFSLDAIQDENNNDIVISNQDGKIRYISVTNKDVVTYKQISVGDNVNIIEDTFTYEYKIDNKYMVIFNGTTEKDPTNQNKEDNWVWVNYITDGSQITKIQIYDVKFGSEMR